MESFYHSLKTELIHFVTGFATRSEAIKLIVEYIERYYNTVRRHSAIDYRAPFVFELPTSSVLIIPSPVLWGKINQFTEQQLLYHNLR